MKTSQCHPHGRQIDRTVVRTAELAFSDVDRFTPIVSELMKRDDRVWQSDVEAREVTYSVVDPASKKQVKLTVSYCDLSIVPYSRIIGISAISIDEKV